MRHLMAAQTGGLVGLSLTEIRKLSDVSVPDLVNLFCWLLKSSNLHEVEGKVASGKLNGDEILYDILTRESEGVYGLRGGRLWERDEKFQKYRRHVSRWYQEVDYELDPDDFGSEERWYTYRSM